MKIALENNHLYQTAEQLSELVDSLDDKFFTVCLDTDTVICLGRIQQA